MAGPRLRLALLIVLPLMLVTGCGSTRQLVRAAPPGCCAGSEGVVFVADGVGDYEATSRAVQTGVLDERMPLCVEKVQWSHGYLRIVADLMDHCNIRAAGCELACRVREYRQLRPDGKVYFLAHSAGCAVVLAAAENLPPDTVDRIVLLAPAVSQDYDLRPALAASRCGIDAFTSDRDRFSLSVGITILGTADRRWMPAAGRVGFRPVICTPPDSALYAKLRQYPWDPCVAWTGNNGGHYATYQPCFLHAYVLPLLRR